MKKMLFKEFLKKNAINSIFINYGYVDKVGSGIATIKGLFNVSAGELVTIYPYKIKAIALNLGTNYVGLILGVLCGVASYIFLNTNIYEAAEHGPFDLSDLTLPLKEVQIRYQHNFELGSKLLIDTGFIDVKNLEVRPVQKEEVLLEEVPLEELNIHKGFLRKLYEYLASFFSGTVDVSKNYSLHYTYKNFFLETNKYNKINIFNVADQLAADISLKPELVKFNLSLLLSDVVIHHGSMTSQDLNEILHMYVSDLESTEEIFEEYLDLVLDKNPSISRSFLTKEELILFENFTKLVENKYPHYKVIVDNIAIFEDYLIANFVYYNETFTSYSHNFSFYTYLNYIKPRLIKHFEMLDVDSEELEYHLKVFSDNMTEYNLYLTIQSDRFLSGQIIKDFLRFVQINNIKLKICE